MHSAPGNGCVKSGRKWSPVQEEVDRLRDDDNTEQSCVVPGLRGNIFQDFPDPLYKELKFSHLLVANGNDDILDELKDLIHSMDALSLALSLFGVAENSSNSSDTSSHKPIHLILRRFPCNVNFSELQAMNWIRHVIFLTVACQCMDLSHSVTLLGCVSHLITLALVECDLTSIPSCFASATPGLMMLTLSHNHLRDLPETLANLRHLTILDLSYNKFTSLPEVVMSIIGMVQLNVSHNATGHRFSIVSSSRANRIR